MITFSGDGSEVVMATPVVSFGLSEVPPSTSLLYGLMEEPISHCLKHSILRNKITRSITYT